MGKKHKNRNRGQQSAPLAAPAPEGSDGEAMIDVDALGGGGDAAPAEEVADDAQGPDSSETPAPSDQGSDGVDAPAADPGSAETAEAEAPAQEPGVAGEGSVGSDTPSVDGGASGDSGPDAAPAAPAPAAAAPLQAAPAPTKVAPKTVVIRKESPVGSVKPVAQPTVTTQTMTQAQSVARFATGPAKKPVKQVVVIKKPADTQRKTASELMSTSIDIKRLTTLGIKVVTMFDEYEKMRRSLNLENRIDRIKCARKLYDVMTLCTPKAQNAQYMHELIQIVFKKFQAGFGVYYTDKSLLSADYELPTPAEAIKFDAFYSAMFQLASAAKTGSRITFNMKSLGTLLGSYGATQAIRSIREKIEARNAQR